MQITNDKIKFFETTILADGCEIRTPHPVADVFQLGERLIILYDPDSYVEKFGQFKNLVAVTLEGKALWTAELPTHDSGDRYYKLASQNPLVAYSIYSYACEIEEATGKIVASRFIK